MKLNEIIKNIACTVVGDGDVIINKIGYNSKAAEAGDLFVCLPGARFDGHDFAAEVYERGVRAFLTERKLPLPDDAVQVVTADSRAALATVAADFYGRPAEKLRLIGITGTKGKTTTSLLCYSILNANGKSCAYIGSNGIMYGDKHIHTANTTPESLVLQRHFADMVESGVSYVVMEVSSQALSHNRVDGLSFEVCAFTNLSPDHIGEGEHADFEDYKNAKSRLFADFTPGCAVFNADDPHALDVIRGYKGDTISFSVEKDADITASRPTLYRSKTSLGISFDCSFLGENENVRLMSPGTFSVYNGLMAIGICSYFGVSLTECAKALEKTPVQGRFEIVEGTPGVTFVIDYSHNGLSLTKALTTLREYSPERLICLFGSVGGRTECRRQELAEAASRYADYSIITSDNPDFEDPDNVISDIASFMGDSPYECITDRKDAIVRAVSMAKEGDIVLFAGKGHEDYQLICGEKVPFCERKIIEEACAALTLN